jgi:hypothetical protein
MCFSAEASFIASGVLAGTGIAISRLPKEKASVPLSLIPAIFATHQLIEGFIWLEHDQPEPDVIANAVVFAYVLIAYALWPIFIPYVAARVETDPRRRQWMHYCQVIGLGVGLAYLVSILRGPVAVSVDACSLSYSVNAPGWFFLPYLAAVSMPFLVSSRRGLVYFGLTIVTSCAAAFYIASMPSFPSVWCFFAAFMSATLYAYFRAEARHGEQAVENNLPTHPRMS